jgi:hypothetical protein
MEISIVFLIKMEKMDNNIRGARFSIPVTRGILGWLFRVGLILFMVLVMFMGS